MTTPAIAAEPDPTRPAFAVFLPQYRTDFASLEARVRKAEQVGFRSVWFMDHLEAPLATEYDCFESFTVATALAARTATIRVGFLTLCNGFRPPALLAKMAASLDVISGGRLDLGLGWGSYTEEFVKYGLPQDPPRVRAARLRETLEVLQLLFTGKEVSYRGEYLSLRGARALPVPCQPHIPIHIGGVGEKLTLPLVRQYADWWNIPAYGLGKFEQLRPLAGDRVRVSLQRAVGLAPPPAHRQRVGEVLQRRFGAWGDNVLGCAEEVADDLAALARRGVSMFILQFHDYGSTETLEHFAAEVIPAVRDRLR